MANNVEITILLDFYGDMLTAKQRDFINLYYNDDLNSLEAGHKPSGCARCDKTCRGAALRDGVETRIRKKMERHKNHSWRYYKLCRGNQRL